MKDRALLVVGLAAMVLGLLGLTLGSATWWSPPPLKMLGAKAAAAVPLPWESKSTGQMAEFKLTVGHVHWAVTPGKVVDAHAYNGQIPGPVLRVTEPDTVRVTVTNTLDQPTTVHWHGVEVPNAMDGVSELSQGPIPPGGTFTDQFIATPAGTRWYHAHFDELTQQGGLNRPGKSGGSIL